MTLAEALIVVNDRTEISESIASNFDHEWDRDVAERLKTDQTIVAGYPAWNFYGFVWWDGEHYQCLVMQYNSPVELIEADTIPEIMEAVSEKYGYG
jgi:hypothetical protein